MAFEQWAVVVVPFPFTDRRAERRRPALVVSHPDALGNRVGQSVLAMITSAALAAADMQAAAAALTRLFGFTPAGP